MSPLDIEIALHYWCSPTQYRDGDFSAPAVREAIQSFVNAGLLRATDQSLPPLGYEAVREALEPYIEGLCAVPLPFQKWVLA